MIRNRSIKKYFNAILLVSLLIVVLYAIQPSSAETTSDWGPHIKVSNSSFGARKPVISSSPVSNRILLVYDHWKSATGDKDPYFAISTNNGETWPEGQAIATTAGGSNQTVGILDYQDTAFAVWIEDSGLASTLAYASKPVNGSWSAATNIQAVQVVDGLLLDPYITVGANNTLHLVWAFQDFTPAGQGRTNIYCASKPQGGSWSSPARINNTAPASREPAIAVDASNNLHIVWEEETISGSEIRYSSGTVSGTTFTPSSNWNYVKLSADTIVQAVLPLIDISENRLQIAYTNLLTQNAQNIYFGSCVFPCTGFNRNNFRSVTSFVSVNGNNPFNLVADLSFFDDENASLIYFHGAQNANANEAVMGVGSCTGWSGAAQDEVTDPALYRAIEPSIAIKGTTLHLAYDRITTAGSGFDHQIYVTKGSIECNNFVYLPVIKK